MTIMQRLEDDPTIVFSVSWEPYPKTPRPYWNGSRRLVFRDKALAFKYCQTLNDQKGEAYSVLATVVREDDDFAG